MSRIDDYMNLGRELHAKEIEVRDLIRERACEVNDAIREIQTALGLTDKDVPKTLEWRKMKGYPRLMPGTQVDDYIGIEGNMERGLWTVVHKRWLEEGLTAEDIMPMVHAEFREASIKVAQKALKQSEHYLEEFSAVVARQKNAVDEESEAVKDFTVPGVPHATTAMLTFADKVAVDTRAELLDIAETMVKEMQSRVSADKKHLDALEKVSATAWLDYMMSIPMPERTSRTRGFGL